MITSSNFFRKTLFGQEDDNRNDWVKEHRRQAAQPTSTSEPPRRSIAERITKKQLVQSPNQQIFRKYQLKATLPILCKELGGGDRNRQTSNRQAFQAIYSSDSEEFNFLRLRRTNNHRRHDSLAAQREKLRYNTLDHSNVRSTSRYHSFELRESKQLRRTNPLNSPDINSRDFMKLVQQRLNRIRLSFS